MISLDLRSLGRTCVQKEEGRMCAVGRMSQRVTHDEKNDSGSCIIMAENNLSIGALDLFKRCNCIGVLEDKNRTEQNRTVAGFWTRGGNCSVLSALYSTPQQSSHIECIAANTVQCVREFHNLKEKIRLSSHVLYLDDIHRCCYY